MSEMMGNILEKPDWEHPDILALCEYCHKEFKLRTTIQHGAEHHDVITLFDDCPHCGTRTDTWIRIPLQLVLIDGVRHYTTETVKQELVRLRHDCED